MMENCFGGVEELLKLYQVSGSLPILWKKYILDEKKPSIIIECEVIMLIYFHCS